LFRLLRNIWAAAGDWRSEPIVVWRMDGSRLYAAAALTADVGLRGGCCKAGLLGYMYGAMALPLVG
jgi:hypothetical protein